jgi:hypothetical protein
MRNFERGDVVRVPFPYTDRPTRQHRPALVVSAGCYLGEFSFRSNHRQMQNAMFDLLISAL